MNGDRATAAPLSVPMVAPLLWRSGQTLTNEQSGAAAVRALATAVSLGERQLPVNEEASGIELEVARLHQKTQLLIELLAMALSRDLSRPQAVSLQLSGSACQWQTATPPALDEIGTVSIWLHPASPEPLTWPAQVTALEPVSAGEVRVEASLLPLGEIAQGVLDRHVFQQHRRAIAEARSQRS